MAIDKEIQEKINILFRNNPQMHERLSACDPDAIREIGSLSQKGIDPDDVIVAYESNDPLVMDYLYQQAKKMIELKKIYKSLNYEYYKMITEEQSNIHKKK